MIVDKFGILKLYPTTGREWFNNWNNGKTRYLKEGNIDPYDSRFKWLCGSPNVTLKIDGNGRAIVNDFTDSARLFVTGPWLNTEMTVYVYTYNSGQNSDVQLRSRSNHEKQCGFGNYLVKWSDSSKKVSVEVEPMHPIYERHLGEKDLPKGLPKEQYIGFKQITRTQKSNNTVKVEGYINYTTSSQNTWIKNTEFVFNGTNVPINTIHEEERLACVDKGDLVANDLSKATLWLNQGQWCWIRTDNTQKVKYKYFSVREIAAL